ncbi:GH116 family glycosyl hydrolase [Leptothoe sp. PORK10 BA2]|uniref:GH116 family glycosyl hydrolase n=1 Tax=Leptothoe sp. PORK10 BA2 TaxID=3110254 RepID=UPI002B212A81|nr:GH116 family glycosyl hydrolase [Leptothoe sp. PORK10 BA2]MEA5466866.1 GH116 family glycosyl hydrolase [Leptothoe sp. PORK10 BA2]
MPAPHIPTVAWTWPIGAKWETPYIVRYASNLDDGPEHGIPLGGLGAGCIGRAPNGTFNLWHLDGGEHTFDQFPACQFAVYEATAGESQTYAMATAGDGLGSWEWYPAGEGGKGGTYQALYPRSWYCYQDIFKAQLTCEQFSPIWPDNYQESSYPVAVFVWTAHNPTEQPITLSILLSWQNMVGWFTNAEASPEIQQREDGSPFYDYVPPLRQSAGNFNRLVTSETATGIVMDGAWTGSPGEGDGQFCIAASGGVTYHTRWNPAGDGADLWAGFAADGTLGNVADTTSVTADSQAGGAIATKITLAPGETQEIPFVLSWDLPVTEFATGKSAYRRYTDFCGRSGRNAWQLAQTALAHYATWQQKIIDWQQPILARPDLPDWFKMALFNELYDMASGGTLWSAASDDDPVGQFGILECIDYRWYESLDVRLYGGFSTLMLWPELEKSIMRAFARAIPTADAKKRIIGYYYTVGAGEHLAPRKIKGATPHDLGAPNENPWVATNYTSYQDCNQWKDLPSDFVLQVYRAFLLTGGDDIAFLADCWPAVTETIQYLKLFDLDGDGVPENGGAPDQTFDDWQLKGLSAYCGGLWLAALEAAIKMGDILQQHQKISGSFAIVKSQYQRWIKQGKIVYQNKLWTGSFYRLDSESNSDVVMADQLCGQFCARLMDLPDIVDPEYIDIALDTIYDACFVKFNQYAADHVAPQNQKFAGAQTGFFSAAQLGLAIGAANGVKPDGSPQNPDDTHQLEVWTGINFGLAAFFAQMGKRAEAMAITEAVVRQIYEHGLQFRTPEAITAVGTFRACHYLRPMAIWGLYQEL